MIPWTRNLKAAQDEAPGLPTRSNFRVSGRIGRGVSLVYSSLPQLSQRRDGDIPVPVYICIYVHT